MNEFYDSIEFGVARYVKALRDAGINTICSCHHEGYIQADSHDPTTERRAIWNALEELGVKEWAAVLTVQNLGNFDSWEIRSNDFKHSSENEHERQ